MTHSFWAIMGGISIDPDNSEPFIPEVQRSTLTANGVSLLLKHEPHLLPDISEEEVKDKSKGSSLTKLVACIQATWFCLSCVARISQRLPVSMLEINTFAHAVCTLIVYILWWRKPLDIEQPLLVHEDRIRPLLAYMWMASKTSCIPKPQTSGNTTTTVGRDPEFEAIIDETTSSGPITPSRKAWSARQAVCASNIQAVPEPSTENLDQTSQLTITVTTSQALAGTGFKANEKSTRWKVSTTHSSGSDEFAKVWTDVYQKPAEFKLTPCDVRRWRLARNAMDKYQLRRPDKNLDLLTVKPIAEHMNQASDTSDEPSKPWSILGFSIVAAAYGGLHALAWNAPFPSHREMVLWRVSALLIASPAASCVLLMLLYYAFVLAGLTFRSCCLSCVVRLAPAPKPKHNRAPHSGPPVVIKEKPLPTGDTAGTLLQFTISILRLLGGVIEGFALAAIMCLYIPARAYLVYESFRTVFYLPPGAYITTSWPQYLPHIT